MIFLKRERKVNNQDQVENNQIKKPTYQSVWIRPIPFWLIADKFFLYQEKREAYPIIRANQKGIFNRAIHHVCFVDREKKIFVAKTLPDIADKNQSVLLFLNLLETTIVGWLKDLNYGKEMNDCDGHEFQHIELPGEWIDDDEEQEDKDKNENKNEINEKVVEVDGGNNE